MAHQHNRLMRGKYLKMFSDEYIKQNCLGWETKHSVQQSKNT